MYAYVNMLGRNDVLITNKLTTHFPERNAIAASLQLRETNDSLGRGFHTLISHVLKAHMLNRLMTVTKRREKIF